MSHNYFHFNLILMMHTAVEVGLVSTSYETSEDAGSVMVCANISSPSGGTVETDLEVILDFSDGTALGVKHI